MKLEARKVRLETMAKFLQVKHARDRMFGFVSNFRDGYAALIATLITLAASLTIIGGLSFFTFQEVRANRVFTSGVSAHYAAEAGVEDAVYRIVKGKQIASVETVTVGTGTATTLVSTSGNQRVVRSEGVQGSLQQNLETMVQTNTTGASFFYGVQIGDGGLGMGNNSIVSGSVYSNGSIVGSNGATITGDATVAGGVTTNPSVQWTTQDTDQNFATAAANRDIAQSFTASATDKVNRIGVYINKVGSPPANLVLHLASDNGGKPATSDLANATIPVGSVGTTPSWITVALASAPTVTNGQTYWILLDFGSNSSTNYWNWRKDTSDGYANNTGTYTSDWTSSGAVWTNVGGDLAFEVWIGGVNTKINSVTVGNASSGTARANLFVNTTVHGSACPNSYCIVENPPRQEMPISDGAIQDFRDRAALGGTCVPPQCDASGNLVISGSQSVGPLKIPGNLSMANGAILTVTGTIWVVGNIQLSNNCSLQVSPAYGALSGVLITDGTIDVSNNCTLAGSGTTGSYILLLSAKNATTTDVIDVSNNSSGVIFYASNGRIHFDNNSGSREATAYGIDLDNGATITYESGLANTQFSSGPSGGYDVKYWKDVE